MKINTIIATLCAVLLSMGLALSANAGSVLDTDGDGVPDAFDNCVNTPNGPGAGTAGCVAQEDGDGDGFGNPCDGDFDNSGGTAGGDFNLILGAFGGSDPNFDLDCSGGISGGDFNAFLLLFGTVPGA